MDYAVVDSVLLERVNELIEKNVDANKVERVRQFVTTLYGDLSHDELRQRNDSDLYGAAISLWNLLYCRPENKRVIRVFNPELSRHGWQSTHTIVEILVKDSPFLVDSVRMTLSRLGVTAHQLIHHPMNLLRDQEGYLQQILSRSEGKKATSFETVFLIEVDRQTDNGDISRLKRELDSVLEEVSLMVDDWKAISNKLAEVIEELASASLPVKESERKETIDFLKWVMNHNFTMMGYRRYDICPIKGDYFINPQDQTSLGLMKRSTGGPGKRLSKLPQSARVEALRRSLLVLTKCNAMSRVHRPAHIDYIGIKRFDDKGRVVGEDRFIGLFASALYNNSVNQIPLIKQRVQRAMAASGFTPGSHSYKTLFNILETYTRDELLHAREEEILEAGLGALRIQERDLTRLIIRKDVFGRYISCMVYVSKERYNTALRIKTQQILARAFHSKEPIEFTTYFAEGLLARTHYMVKVDNNNMEFDANAIQAELIEVARTWEDKLRDVLLNDYGEASGNRICRRYAGSFPPAYRDEVFPSSAVADICQLEQLSDEHTLGMLFYRPQEEAADSNLVKLKLFHKTDPIHLSDVLPMLENMGLTIIGESPYEIPTTDGAIYWILDFEMLHTANSELDLDKSQPLFQSALAKIWSGELENDGFNRLVLGAGLNGDLVAILRAYAKYLRQIGYALSQTYIESTLARYPKQASLLISLFGARFNPDSTYSHDAESEIKEQLLATLDQVANLDDDRIIRLYIELIEATLRTNFYQSDDQGRRKSYTSFKFASRQISEIPLPAPEYEIFVYSPRVEGVHLRGGKVARGGLRWSDRREDFRTEVLGLVKAQQVKNTVIVPVGAKGGFVCKRLSQAETREGIINEGKICYRLFIRGLLDITDNVVKGNIVPPERVIRHDDDDPYLVVAADKGTASFSDIANGISEEYGFWLRDAFASGGSVGYDHKKMGITARGAWESVKRHFREMDIDCQTTDFTCVGIGDMSGDVFGNGMLLSRHIRLVAAFNHQHIFIDPSPDPERSYQERQRLFALATSSWSDYDSSCLSEGGGIYSRSVKAIHLTPQIKAMLDCDSEQLTPNALIHQLLKMKVDLLWNGGIGTYVKSREEAHIEVGDRTNDSVRINGDELRAKVVGEGGNLGFTQLGRVEFALNGGRINTDFIDNVGGVDCSDNEVNIKILLNALVDQGELTVRQRNQLLNDMTGDVAQIVLTNAYRLSQSLSVTMVRGKSLIRQHLRVIHSQEREGLLHRAIEYIPTDEEIAERQAADKSLTRPELAVLLAYVKMQLKAALPDVLPLDDKLSLQYLYGAFPRPLRKRFKEAILAHPLRRELVATQVANALTNDMGLDYVQRMKEETGAELDEIALVYMVASSLFEMASIWRELEALDNQLPAGLQLSLMSQNRRMVRHVSRWFLRHRDRSLSAAQLIDKYRDVYQQLRKDLYRVMDTEEVEYYRNQVQELEQQGLPNHLAQYFADLSTLFSAMDLADIANEVEVPVEMAAQIYFNLGVQLDLHWFLEQINKQPVNNHWQALARASFREELDWQQRALTISVLKTCTLGNSAEMLQQWLESNAKLLQRWYHLLSDFRTSNSHEFAKFSVALRELSLLNLNCKFAC